MMVQWNAAAGELLIPETSPVVAEVSETITPPAGPEERFTHIHGLGLGLNANAPDPEGASSFLAWLSTEKAALAYAAASGAPALSPDVVAKIAEERPDLAKLGEFAGSYGFVMNGATSANALAVYELQARKFTGYWAGQQDLDSALANTVAGMEELLK